MKKIMARKIYFVFILLLSSFIISGCGSDGGGGSWIAPPPPPPGDTTSPLASFTAPASGATFVPTGNRLTVTFSEAMDPATIDITTFTLQQTAGLVPVPGAVTYTGLVATFTPTLPLAALTNYTGTITTGAKDLAGNALASDYVWTFTTGAGPDGTPPTVTLTDPLNGAGVVALNKKIAATFSEAMDPATLTAATFTLEKTVGAVPVAGAVTYAGLVATFTPTSALTAGTNYTATITTGATDLAVPGNPLAANYVWTFTTGAGTDIIAPTVTLTDPVNSAAGVATNQKITATFSEAMDPATVTAATFGLKQGAAVIPGTVTLVGRVATFTPTAPLATLTTYTATMAAGAKDLAGNALVVPAVGLPPNPWSFTTGAAADGTNPTVTLTDPVNGAVSVALSKKIKATFSESMDPATLTNLTFTLKETVGSVPVPGTVSYVGLVVTFTPTSLLTAGLSYTAEVTTGATDLAGNPLVAGILPNPWTFTTIAAAPLGPAPVDLGTAADFVILSKSGITNVPPSAVGGNMGVSPITFASITGFTLTPNDASATFSTAPQVTAGGKVYAADYQVPTPAKLTTAISDMETAYTDAAGRAVPAATELGAGNLTGLNLAPGLYKWGTDVSVDAAGTVTLTGTAVDVWIMQVAGNITMNPGSRVTLAGGALAKNVFWQIGGGVGVAFDTGVAFQGNVLAENAITMNALATVTGRLLSQKEVTMISNTITAP